MPNPSYHSRKYNLNQNFFSKWTPEMAYVFGFWCADGDMKIEKSYRVNFCSADVEILRKIRDCAGSNAKIYRFYRNGALQNSYYLTLHSKRLYYDLKSLGGKRRKSTKIKFPYVPKILLADYIRGYFDGDGSVHQVTYKATKNEKYYTEIRSNFTSGSKMFLKSLREKLANKLGLAERAIGQYGPYQFKLGYGQKDTNKLLNFMYYQNHPISLDRKAKYIKKM